MRDLREYIKEGFVNEAKRFNWTYCFCFENLMGAEAASVYVDVQNATNFKRMFSGIKYKDYDNNWSYITEDFADQVDRTNHYLSITFDSRGEIDIEVYDYDSIDEFISNVEDEDQIEEGYDKFTMQAFDEFIMNSMNTSSIKGQYIKY